MTTPQAPLNSPFGYRSTARAVIAGIDLTGQTALVTGGYSGLGTEVVRALAAAGAHVSIGARRPDAALNDLIGIDGQISVLPMSRWPHRCGPSPKK